MKYIISDHNFPIKLKKILKNIEGDKCNTIDYMLYINQSEPTEKILDILESNPEISNIEKELSESILAIFNKYKEKLK